MGMDQEFSSSGLLDAWDDTLLAITRLTPVVSQEGVVFKRLLDLLAAQPTTSAIGRALTHIGTDLSFAAHDGGGPIERRANQLRHAQEFLRVGLSLEPMQGRMWFHLAEVSWAVQDNVQAIQAFENYLEEEVDDGDAHAKVANCYWKMMRYAKARAHAELALQLSAEGSGSAIIAKLTLDDLNKLES